MGTATLNTPTCCYVHWRPIWLALSLRWSRLKPARMITFMVRTVTTTTDSSEMPTLGRLLELTIAGEVPPESEQFTADGARLRWLGEGALEVTPANGLDSGL